MAALLACIGITLTLTALGVGNDVAGASATALFGTVPFLRDSLDRLGNGQSGQPRHLILSIGGYALPAPRLLLYGLLMQYGIMQFSSAFAGVVDALDQSHRQVLPNIAIFGYLINVPGMFFIGRWVGRRAATHGVITVLGIAVLVRVLGTAGDLVYLRFFPDSFTDAGPLSDLFSSFLIITAQIGAGVMLLSAAGLLGYWRGTRQRLGNYIAYLLRSVSDETKAAIVDLAFEEAEREHRQQARNARNAPTHGISVAAQTPG